jgi:hypothetical protein
MQENTLANPTLRPLEHGVISFLPISLVLATANHLSGTYVAWRHGFVVGAIVAGLTYALAYHRKSKIDPFADGINLFIFVSAITFVTSQVTMLNFFDSWRESSSLIFVSFVGLSQTFLKPGRFSDIDSSVSVFKRRIADLILITLFLAAIPWAKHFQGSIYISITTPYIFAFIVRAYVQRYTTPHKPKLMNQFSTSRGEGQAST